MKIELAPQLVKFVAAKIKNGDYVDAGEVIRASLRRWKEQEESHLRVDLDWVEQEIQDGLESADLPETKTFWTDLRQEVHREHKSDAAQQ